MVTGDYNNDTVLDLAVINYGSSTVSVLLGNGNGTFKLAVNSTPGQPLSVAVGDFDDDGKLDIATANVSDVSVMRGNGDGTFDAPASIALSDGSSRSPSPWATSPTARWTSGDVERLQPRLLRARVLGIRELLPGNWYPSVYTGSAHVLTGDGLGNFSDEQHLARYGLSHLRRRGGLQRRSGR